MNENHSDFDLSGAVPRIEYGLPAGNSVYSSQGIFFDRDYPSDRAKAPGDRIKRAVDIALAGLLLAFIAPVFLGLALIIRGDGGPVIFKHRRIGRRGQEFHCLKFRSMVVDADHALQRALAADPVLAAEWKSTRKLRNDPRITPVGRLLRATSMDELPQLINVLRGEMSLVGPRPVLRQEYEDFYIPLGGASAYVSVRPGLTGLWQVSGRSDTSYEARVALDVKYTKTPSLYGDFKILARTVGVVLRRQGAC